MYSTMKNTHIAPMSRRADLPMAAQSIRAPTPLEELKCYLREIFLDGNSCKDMQY